MKKELFGLLLALLVLLSLPAAAFADDPPIEVSLEGAVFTGEGKMNFDARSTIRSQLSGLQPGDTMILHIPVYNDNAETTDWYMKNWVQESLEDKSANHNTEGGGYTYRLIYTGPGTTGGGDVLYDSERVGGDDPVPGREGLHEATGSLEDYFFLDTLRTGQGGEVVLTLSLDGESQGNDYQDTLGILNFQFAVEMGDTDHPNVVKTGDPFDLGPFYLVMFVSGLVILYLTLDAVTDRIYGYDRKRG